MIIIILSLALIITLGLLISTFILIKILQKKIEIYEDWILDVKTDVIQTLEQMRAIDVRGSFITTIAGGEKGGFESDDEIGVVFKEMLELIEKLNQRTK